MMEEKKWVTHKYSASHGSIAPEYEGLVGMVIIFPALEASS